MVQTSRHRWNTFLLPTIKVVCVYKDIYSHVFQCKRMKKWCCNKDISHLTNFTSRSSLRELFSVKNCNDLKVKNKLGLSRCYYLLSFSFISFFIFHFSFHFIWLLIFHKSFRYDWLKLHNLKKKVFVCITLQNA